MIDAGWELLQGLWEGISQAATWLWEKISGWLDGLWKGILDFFGIESPSKEMKWVGKMLTEGLADGIEDNASSAITAAEDMASDILNSFGAVDGAEVGLNAAVNGNPYGTTFIQNNYSPKALSRLDIYRYGNNLAAYMGAQ